jgi:hypothetical protein
MTYATDPPPSRAAFALILEKGSDGKFITKSNSWKEKRTLLPGRALTVVGGRLGDKEGSRGGPAIADRYVSRPSRWRAALCVTHQVTRSLPVTAPKHVGQLYVTLKLIRLRHV